MKKYINLIKQAYKHLHLKDNQIANVKVEKNFLGNKVLTWTLKRDNFETEQTLILK